MPQPEGTKFLGDEKDNHNFDLTPKSDVLSLVLLVQISLESL